MYFFLLTPVFAKDIWTQLSYAADHHLYLLIVQNSWSSNFQMILFKCLQQISSVFIYLFLQLIKVCIHALAHAG